MSEENKEEMESIQDSLDKFLKNEARLKDDLIIKKELEPEFQYFFLDWSILEESFEALD